MRPAMCRCSGTIAAAATKRLVRLRCSRAPPGQAIRRAASAQVVRMCIGAGQLATHRRWGHSGGGLWADVWDARISRLRNALAKQIAQRLDPLDPVGWNHAKTGWVIDFTRATASDPAHATNVVLVRVGDFYEAHGLSAVMLVEHAGLNPMGNWQQNGCRAGTPVLNVQRTLDALILSGLTVVVCEERDGQANQRKQRFVSEIISAHNPKYTYEWQTRESDGSPARDALPFVGIRRDASGLLRVTLVDMDNATIGSSAPCTVHAELSSYIPYNSVSFSGSSSEASAPPLATLFVCGPVPKSIAPGVPRQTLVADSLLQFERALLGAVCGQHAGLRPDDFRQSSTLLRGRRPLHGTTAAELGVGTELRRGVPSLLSHLARPGVPVPLPVQSWYRMLLNNPPPSHVRNAIRSICEHLLSTHDAMPTVLPLHGGTVLRGLRSRQASPRVLSELREALVSVSRALDRLPSGMAKDILLVARELSSTSGDNGLESRGCPIDDTVVRLNSAISLIDSCIVPSSLLTQQSDYDNQDVDSNWPTVKTADLGQHSTVGWESSLGKVEPAIRNLARQPDREGLLHRIAGVDLGDVTATRSTLNETVTRFVPAVKERVCYEHRTGTIAIAWPRREGAPMPRGRAGWELIRARSGKVVEGRWSNPALREANDAYTDACEVAMRRATARMRGLCSDLYTEHLGIVLLALHFCQAFEALRMHAEAAQIKQWCVAQRVDEKADVLGGVHSTHGIRLAGVWPYWLAMDESVCNDYTAPGMTLLTAPNMSGKSTFLRSVAASALLANCGLCVPAETAQVPIFDTIFLRNAAFDLPMEGKSSFGAEMADIGDLLSVTTGKSLVLVDELGKGTSSSEGAAISSAILEHFCKIGTLGVFASHLFEIFSIHESGVLDLPHIQFRTMAVSRAEDGAIKWEYRLESGRADSSLALDAALAFGVPESIVNRAHRLLLERTEESPSPVLSRETSSSVSCGDEELAACRRSQRLDVDAEQKFVLSELRRISQSEVYRILPGQVPAPRHSLHSVVYVLQMAQPDGRWYVGESEDIGERLVEHRRDETRADATCHYVLCDGGKSTARDAETTMIKALTKAGVPLMSRHDGGRTRVSTSAKPVWSAADHRTS